MKICSKCNVRIADNTDVCPLCRRALPKGDGTEVNMYPDVAVAVRKFRLFENIFLFASLLAAFTVVYVDWNLGDGITWSLVVLIILTYCNLILRVAITGDGGYLSKTIIMAILGIAVISGIDVSTGYRGWAFDYAVPCIIMGLDLSIIILMIANHRNWQSYMLFQIFNIILSILALIPGLVGIAVHPLLSRLALIISVFLFLGTLIIGDKRARDELYRRFHI